MNDYTKLPRELTEHPLWCVWRYGKDRDGRRTKLPINPATGRAARTNSPETFAPFAAALEAYKGGGYEGLGILLGGCLGAYDIDHCLDDQGSLPDVALDVVGTMDTYTEISPSGRGLRGFFLVGDSFQYNRAAYYIKRGDLEIYTAGTWRFVTVTGHRLPQGGGVEDREEELSLVLEKYMRRNRQLPADRDSYEAPELMDDEVLSIARHARNKEAFSSLWAGDAGEYRSHSEADQALCNLLAFYAGPWGHGQIDRLFRMSGLYRDKWEREDYRNDTIQKAIDGCRTFYQRDKSRVLPDGDRTDVGQAKVLSDLYQKELRYTEQTGWIHYEEGRWIESDLAAQGIAQALTDRQLQEVRRRMRATDDAMAAAAESGDEDALKEAKAQQARNNKDLKYVMGRRSSKSILSTMTQAKSMLALDPGELDGDPLKLNTPAGTVDLKTGALMEHDPDDFITKMCAVSPDDRNKDVFLAFLDRITCGDKELASYLQEVAGMIAVGKIYSEHLLIAYGEGGNGKSTFFNLLRAVLKDYAVGISAVTLTTGCRQNKDPEIVRLRGARLAVAGELEEGARLDMSVVKKITSTDPITSRKLYREGMDFTPSHSTILFTNHLPKVGGNDAGTWSRLVTVPFKANLRGQAGEVKNYADVLFHECGGAVLSWMVEGARIFLRNGGKITTPDAVKSATEEYRLSNDWVHNFVSEECEVGPEYKVPSSILFAAYTNWCYSQGEYRRDSKDFKAGLMAAGFDCKRTKTGMEYKGLRIIQKPAEDFL